MLFVCLFVEKEENKAVNETQILEQAVGKCCTLKPYFQLKPIISTLERQGDCHKFKASLTT